MSSLLCFLGVRELELGNLETRYHVAGSSGIVSSRLAEMTPRSRRMRGMGKRAIPERYRRRIRLWSIMNRQSPESAKTLDTSLSPETRCRLASYFLEDALVLEALIGKTVPWRNWFEGDMRNRMILCVSSESRLEGGRPVSNKR